MWIPLKKSVCVGLVPHRASSFVLDFQSISDCEDEDDDEDDEDE